MIFVTFPIGGVMISRVPVRVVPWWVAVGSGSVSQRTRFMLRLGLRQLGTHFFSDLVAGDAGAGAAGPCFLGREREKPDTVMRGGSVIECLFWQ